MIRDRFWLRFWSFFGILLALIFSIFHDTPNIAILQQVPSETLIFTFQILSILNKISINFWCFFGSRFRTPFFRHFSNMILKNIIFGPPLGSSWVQNGIQNRPSGAKMLKCFIDRSHFGGVLNRPCFSLNHNNLKRRFGMKICTLFHIFLTRSAKISKDLPRSNKINQRIGKHKPASATCRNKSWNAELQKWGGGGVTPHGVFNKYTK